MSEGTIPVPAGTGTQDVPLKQRFYYYRGKVLRFRKAGSDADERYWALRNAPVLTSLNPNTDPHGTGGFTITITGTRFVNDSTVHFGTNTAPATTVNDTIITVNIPSGYDQTPAVYQVSVESPGGVMSNSLPFTVT